MSGALPLTLAAVGGFVRLAARTFERADYPIMGRAFVERVKSVGSRALGRRKGVVLFVFTHVGRRLACRVDRGEQCGRLWTPAQGSG